jgi:hypothetical protein
MTRKPQCRPGTAAVFGKMLNMSAPQLTAQDDLAGCINAMHLKGRLCDIQTDCRN